MLERCFASNEGMICITFSSARLRVMLTCFNDDMSGVYEVQFMPMALSGVFPGHSMAFLVE